MIGRLVSRYRVVEELGHGGMGVVYKARDIRLERYVALKFLGSPMGETENARRRFMQEARAASALDHPNISHDLTVSRTPTTGGMFIAMACYEGDADATTAFPSYDIVDPEPDITPGTVGCALRELLRNAGSCSRMIPLHEALSAAKLCQARHAVLEKRQTLISNSRGIL